MTIIYRTVQSRVVKIWNFEIQNSKMMNYDAEITITDPDQGDKNSLYDPFKAISGSSSAIPVH